MCNTLAMLLVLEQILFSFSRRYKSRSRLPLPPQKWRGIYLQLLFACIWNLYFSNSALQRFKCTCRGTWNADHAAYHVTLLYSKRNFPEEIKSVEYRRNAWKVPLSWRCYTYIKYHRYYCIYIPQMLVLVITCLRRKFGIHFPSSLFLNFEISRVKRRRFQNFKKWTR